MGFVSKFAKMFGKSPLPDTGVPALTHRRYHTRYPLIERDLCLLEHPRYGLFQVIDLSFNGCLVEPIMGASFEGLDTAHRLVLTTLGRSIELDAKQIQRRRNGWAVIFHHADETSLLALSSVVEPLRCGFSAISMPVDGSKDAGKSKNRKRFSGDGPFDLLIEKSETDTVIFAMVTIRRGDIYASVLWEGGNIVTKRSADQQGVGTRMLQTAQVDDESVWAAAVACLGMKFAEGAVIARLLNLWMTDKVKTA